MFRKSKSIVIIILFFSSSAFAQETISLSEAAFMQQFLQNGPLIESSGLKQTVAAYKLEAASAPFQPFVQSKQSTKEFNDINYYNKNLTGFNIQSPFAVGIESGFDRAVGNYVSSENNTPDAGLAFLGIEIPLGAGLLIDKERANLRAAKLDNTAAIFVNQNELNYYAFQANKTYWKWYESNALRRLAEQAVSQAERRYIFTIQKSEAGNLAPIDTLEALINLQNRRAVLYETQILNVRMRNELANFIWDSELQSLNFLPDTFSTTLNDTLLLKAFYNHPVIRLIEIDSSQIMLDRQLAIEYMKPKVDVRLGTNQAWNLAPSMNNPVDDNFYFGWDISMPLFLREQRAMRKKADLELAMVNNSKLQTMRTLNSKRNELVTNMVILQENVNLLRNASVNYFTLLQAENDKFNVGESSLFIVNNRELRWMDAQMKYIKSYTDFRITRMEQYYLSGTLHRLFN